MCGMPTPCCLSSVSFWGGLIHSMIEQKIKYAAFELMVCNRQCSDVTLLVQCTACTRCTSSEGLGAPQFADPWCCWWRCCCYEVLSVVLFCSITIHIRC